MHDIRRWDCVLSWQGVDCAGYSGLSTWLYLEWTIIQKWRACLWHRSWGRKTMCLWSGSWVTPSVCSLHLGWDDHFEDWQYDPLIIPPDRGLLWVNYLYLFCTHHSSRALNRGRLNCTYLWYKTRFGITKTKVRADSLLLQQSSQASPTCTVGKNPESSACCCPLPTAATWWQS